MVKTHFGVLVVVSVFGLTAACARATVSAGDATADADATQIDGATGSCGDGHLDPGEGCDDGNTVSGDDTACGTGGTITNTTDRYVLRAN